MFQKISLLILATAALFLTGCASGKFKARQEQRDKMASASGMYCEFISGEVFPDLEVELNMQMAKRCDSNKNFSITNYKNSSEQLGVIYCCASQAKVEAPKVDSMKSEKSEKRNTEKTPKAEETKTSEPAQ